MSGERVGVRAYRTLTRLYPRRFRDEYATDMVALFRRAMARRADVESLAPCGTRLGDHDSDPTPGDQDASNPEPSRPRHLPGHRRGQGSCSQSWAAPKGRP